jgi:hypothetical protein
MHPGMSFAVGQTPLKGREESQNPKNQKFTKRIEGVSK